MRSVCLAKMELLREYSSDSDSVQADIQELQNNNTGFSLLVYVITYRQGNKETWKDFMSCEVLLVWQG